jgi:hypothetical protein
MSIKLFKNFKEVRAFKPPFQADAIYGGALLGVRSGEVRAAPRAQRPNPQSPDLSHMDRLSPKSPHP